MSQLTSHQAKYFAWELTRRRRGGDLDRVGQALFDASVDLNPHQIEAALFALANPLSRGVLLADEVGLGKTIEAALVLGQYWAERRRRLLVVCPASLRKQWATELSEKFHLPTQVIDAETWSQARKAGVYNPLDQDVISIVSIHFAARMEQAISAIRWDLAVIDEAHKLRNAYREAHTTGQAIKRGLAGVRKVLLTATPLQNSLLELYGLSTIIDEHLFGDRVSFRSRFMRGDSAIPALRNRLADFSKRSLRRDVLEYVQYTERKAMTFPFTPGDDEQRVYDLVSGYLLRVDGYGVPSRQRHLVGLILRKLLASSTPAVVATLEAILARLRRLEESQADQGDWLTELIRSEELDAEELDEDEQEAGLVESTAEPAVDRERLRGEIVELEQYLLIANGVREDQKSHALVKALDIGFQRMASIGAARKAVVFTESVRTQDYLARFLEAHGHAGRVAKFSGRASDPGANGIYQRWLATHQGTDRVTGSPAIDRRTAVIDHFRDQAEILICTEAGAEGINLQFCSLVVNYDLPWNPQRVEQRIGRCHRYGQKHDVVVVNFLNQRNAADQRVLELLSEKFHLFDGVFGASDEILGRIENGVDIERRIAGIFDTCRTPADIDAAFAALRSELESQIQERMKDTEEALLATFDAGVVERLRLHRDQAIVQLDRISQLFWRLTRHVLASLAQFNDKALSFELAKSPSKDAEAGRYHLIRKGQPMPEGGHVYRLTHPLGEFVLDTGRRLDALPAELVFDLSSAPQRIAALEQLTSKSGWLELNLLELESFQLEEHLVFSAQADDGRWVDAEACQRMLELAAAITPDTSAAEILPANFEANVRRQIDAALAQALEENNTYFQAERDKLDRWAEDQLLAAEQSLHDTKARLKDAKRRARSAATVEEQARVQEEIKTLERQQRRQRQEIFDVEDEIGARRDALIAALEKRLNQSSHSLRLFRIRWRLH
ncbi:Helicase conserved C-terminal domain-containing protein [Hydrocarboniphaga daqingensis]|uniref:Helicase conserved C-terminal domain-containing protein n=1 Tax=Hydrocarboniphaga daqingensis TaxID=490188 RepID=A0A1M5P7X9_9GAMM|nr:SNF2-related protein [Hydrocarboniphaga daqingensis]SHG97941.1 Helicase conserved C-terminal domain-containing protein [Hydrocarboniphaga daqingensis]